MPRPTRSTRPPRPSGSSRSPSWTDPLPVRRVMPSRYAARPTPAVWPETIPAIAQVLSGGLDLSACTVLVGENGSGKSTLIEAIAMAFGLAAEGGSTGALHSTYASESPLHEWLTLERGAGASKWGYFIRAETMHGLFSYLEGTRSDAPWSRDPNFHHLSHGESFVALLGTRRFAGEGFFVMDEPEAGLSFQAQLHLVAELAAMAGRKRTQVLIATHSPVIAAIPGAQLLELGSEGITQRQWADLDVVGHYARFIDAPQRYLRHVIDDPLEQDPDWV